MGFFVESLKKAFIYTGDTTNENISIDKIKDSVSNKFNKLTKKEITTQYVLTDNAKDEMYTSLYNYIQSQINGPYKLVEAKCLFNKFLEEQIIQESQYTEMDLLYLKKLIEKMKSLKEPVNMSDKERKDLINTVCSNKYLITILELLNGLFKIDVLSEVIPKSYIFLKYSHKPIKQKANDNSFSIRVADTYFLLPDSLKTIINDEMDIELKRNYVVNKIKESVNFYLTVHSIPAHYLLTVLFYVNNGKEEHKAQKPTIIDFDDLPLVEENKHKSVKDVDEVEVLLKQDNIQILKNHNNIIEKYKTWITKEGLELYSTDDYYNALKEFEDLINSGVILTEEENNMYEKMSQIYLISKRMRG